MIFTNLLLFLAVFVSSPSRCTTRAIRHGASSIDKEPARQVTADVDHMQDKQMVEDLPALNVFRRGVGGDPRLFADDTTDVQGSPGHAHHISVRSASNENQTAVLNESTNTNVNDYQSVCEHRLEGMEGVLSSYHMGKSLSCTWNISAPSDFFVTMILTVLKFNGTSFALASGAGESCLANGTRIVVTEFLPDVQPMQTAFCEATSAKTAASIFTTFGNKVSINVHTRRGSHIAWALWYLSLHESDIEEIYGYTEDIRTGMALPKLVTASYELLEQWSGISAEECFEIDGTTIRSKNGNNGNCSLTFLPDTNEELTLSFLGVDLSDPSITNCSYEHAFITIRTWKFNGNVNETFLCSIPSVGAQFTSPVRIELNYHPSAVTLRDFTAEISIVDINIDGADLLDLLLKNTLVSSLTDKRGNLATLAYPNDFSNMRMIWEISVGKGKAVNLEFVDIDLGYKPPSTCNETTPILLIILSPSQDKQQQIYCGTLPPRNITSKGSKMTIIFDPKGGNGGRGIQAVYSSFDYKNDTLQGNLDIEDTLSLLPELPIPPSLLRVPTTVFGNCEFLLMKDSGNFATLDYPIDNTMNSTSCWQILSNPVSFIQSLFSNFPFLDLFDKGDDEIGAPATYKAPLAASFSTSLADEDHFRGNLDFDDVATLPSKPTVPSAGSTNALPAPAYCLHTFTENNGTFFTLRYPDDYPANYSSCWYISTDPSRFIMLRFLNFSLDSARVDPCDTAYSFVTVNDFVADEVVLCGTLENKVIKSSSNRLKIKIKGRLGRGQGFYAMYETFKIPRFRSHLAAGDTGRCTATEHLESLIVSGTVRLPALMSKCTMDGNWVEWFTEPKKESGWIASPMFPGQYPAGSHCIWVVRAEGNANVNLNFLDFNLGEAPGTYPPCSDADTFIRIRDCVSGEEQTVCGIKTEHEQLMIQSNSVEIEFYSKSGNGRGFQAFYKLEQSSVEVHQFRALPEGPTPLPAFRGMSTEEPQHTQPQMPTMQQEVDEATTMNPLCKGAGSDTCGGSFQSEFGYFSSEFYPEDFEAQTNCIWTISSSLPGHQIALKILDIDFGAPVIDGECDVRYGYIKIEISGYSAFLCSNQGQNLFLSEGGLIRVEFSSEFSVGRGFCAAFMSVDSSFNGSIADLEFPCLCENIYTNISRVRPSKEPTEPARCEFMIGEGSGTFPSDTFPSPYPPNMECVWTLSAGPGEVVNLRFLSFDLDGFRTSNRRRCLLSDTHVQITLFKETKVSNKRFCSDDDWSGSIPPSRDVTVKFVSGDVADHSYTGFRLAYNFTRTEVFRQDLAENASVSESSVDNFGFRFFNDYDGYSSVSVADSPDEAVNVETGRRTTEDDRTRLTWPVEEETEIPDLGLFSDMATELPDAYDTELPEEEESAVGQINADADILTTASSERPLRTYSVDELGTRASTSPKSGVIPGRGQMTAREIELTIYICTALAALLVIVLILVTLYCAKTRRRNSKSGFDVDAADEANYWQTYKDWAKDWVTEPVAGSVQSTVSATCGHENEMAPPKYVPSSGDAEGVGASASSPGHHKTVSAVVNLPPMDKPERNFIHSEKLV